MGAPNVRDDERVSDLVGVVLVLAQAVSNLADAAPPYPLEEDF